METRFGQESWWDIVKCYRCNARGEQNRGLRKLKCPDCDGTGWTKWATIPAEPHSEIIPGLWQGGILRTTDSVLGSRTPHYALIDLFGESLSPNKEHVEYIRFPFPDSPTALTDPSIEGKVHHIAKRAARLLDKGETVLVRCQAGLNRSGLIVGLTLMQAGYPAETAIDLMRARRSPWVLCNPFFEEYLLQYESGP